MNSMQPDDAGIKVIPPVYFFAAIGLGLLVNMIFPLSVLDFFIIKIIGVVCILASLIFSFWAVLGQKKAKTSLDVRTPTTKIVMKGAYRLTRNPMYLGAVVFISGIGLAIANTWILLTVPLLVIILNKHVIEREESYLMDKFGDEYKNYCHRVKRWL